MAAAQVAQNPMVDRQAIDRAHRMGQTKASRLRVLMVCMIR